MLHLFDLIWILLFTKSPIERAQQPRPRVVWMGHLTSSTDSSCTIGLVLVGDPPSLASLKLERRAPSEPLLWPLGVL